MKRHFTRMILTALLLATPAVAADVVVGKWKTVDDKTGKMLSDVEIYDQGGKLFGKIVGLAEPNDTQGKPKICTKCTGADKDKPIVGLVIIKDLGRDRDHWKGETILASNGRSWKT